MIEGPHFSVWISAGRRSEDQKILISRRLIPLATRRNWWRRRIREVLRKNKAALTPGLSLRIKLHTCGKTRPRFNELERELLELFKRSAS